MTDVVNYSLADGVATLTMDDGKANALSLDMSGAISDGLDRAATDARVVVITGRPGILCGGFDLRVIRGDDDGARKRMRDGGFALLKRLYLHPQPVIFACTGHAVAAGALLLLVGDVRIGVEGDFRIGLNEVAIGLTLPPYALELARDRLSAAALTPAVLESRLYDAAGAREAGYLDETAPDADFAARVAARAQSFFELDAAAFAETKRRLRQPVLERGRGVSI
jgi:enoyl-CoA hydratase